MGLGIWVLGLGVYKGIGFGLEASGHKEVGFRGEVGNRI